MTNILEEGGYFIIRSSASGYRIERFNPETADVSILQPDEYSITPQGVVTITIAPPSPPPQKKKKKIDKKQKQAWRAEIKRRK